MHRSAFDSQHFLDRYREAALAVVRLGRSIDAAPAQLLNELGQEPFAVPGFMRGLEGARALGERLAALAAEVPADVHGALVTELRAEIRRVVFGVYDIHDMAIGERSRGAHAKPPAPPPPPSAPSASVDDGQLLGGAQSDDGAADGDEDIAPMPAAPAIAAPAPSGRWINAELEDHPLDDPLEVGTSYTMAFDVDMVRRPNAVATVIDDRGLFPPGVEEVTLTVQLGGADFTISDAVRPLHLPRAGRSRGKARFDITPSRAGRVMLQATIHANGNFVQQMEIVLFAVPAGRRASDAPAASVTSLGRPAGAVGTLRPRDFGLVIKPERAVRDRAGAGDDGGYACTAWGSGFRDVILPIQREELAVAIGAARQALLAVVKQRDATGNFPFQVNIDIPAEESDKALRTLARAGALLFDKIFNHPAAGQEIRDIGDALRTRALSPTPSKIQIIARDFPVPWTMLYAGDASDGAMLDWHSFLGFGHIVEQLPLEARFTDKPPTIASTPRLSVSVNVNTGIDAQMGRKFVAEQRQSWNVIAGERKRLRLTERETRAQVLQAFGSPPEDDQIAYFYCHADSADLAARGGPGGSCLVMSGNQRLTLDDLNLNASTRIQLGGNPLVFINACESAELSPAFYDGFVPYFMAKGARGVIGTECKTPALFAAEWARRFFDRFLNGEPIGDAFLALRTEFLTKHRNPLGLLYAVHCDGDTLVAPSLSASPPP